MLSEDAQYQTGGSVTILGNWGGGTVTANVAGMTTSAKIKPVGKWATIAAVKVSDASSKDGLTVEYPEPDRIVLRGKWEQVSFHVSLAQEMTPPFPWLYNVSPCLSSAP